MDLNEARQRYPQLSNLDDNAAVDVLHTALYKDWDRNKLAEAFGVTPAAPKADANAPGDMSRGFQKSMLQIPQTGGGLVALAGDLMGSEGIKNYGLDIYKKRGAQIDALTKPSDSFTTSVLEGEGDVPDFFQHAAGYVGGQALSALATGGIGGFIGKQLAKQGVQKAVQREVAERVAARTAAVEAAPAAQRALMQPALEAANATLERRAMGQIVGGAGATGAKVGAAVGLGGSNLMQEAGSIYPEAVEHAAEQGTELTGWDKARVVGSALAAAGVETLTDSKMLSAIRGGGRRTVTNAAGEQVQESLGRAIPREIGKGMVREGSTEGVQTEIERFGAGKELTGAEAIRDVVDSSALGAIGGGMGGAVTGLHGTRPPEQAPQLADTGPISQAANVVLALENKPASMYAFPDGSQGDEAAVNEYLKTIPDPQRREQRRREMLGLDMETGAKLVDDAKSQELIKMASAKREPMPLELAEDYLKAAEHQNKTQGKKNDLTIVPHASGTGFVVVPHAWLSVNEQAKAIGAAREYREQIKAGNSPAKPTADQQAEQTRKDLEAQGYVGLTLNAQGQPFRARVAAVLKAKQLGEGHEVLEIPGGFGVLPPAPAQEAPQAAQESANSGTSAPSPVTQEIEAAANEAATSEHNSLPEPTQAQKEAGNYKVGRVKLHGMDISIENPAGSKRKGVDADGRAWENELAHHYGYIRKTEGADGDHVDTFIGGNPESETAFVVDQYDPKTGKFDEHKAVLGANSAEEASQIYHANYEPGWQGAGSIHSMPMAQFKEWLKGDTTKPVSGVESIAPAQVDESAETHKNPVDEAENLHKDGEKEAETGGNSTTETPAQPAAEEKPKKLPYASKEDLDHLFGTLQKKQIPDMTDAELLKARELYAPDHKRRAKIDKAIEARGLGEGTPVPAEPAPAKDKPARLKERDAKIAAKQEQQQPQPEEKPASLEQQVQDFIDGKTDTPPDVPSKVPYPEAVKGAPAYLHPAQKLVVDLMNGDITKPQLVDGFAKLEMTEGQISSVTDRISDKWTIGDARAVLHAQGKRHSLDPEEKPVRAPKPAPAPTKAEKEPAPAPAPAPEPKEALKEDTAKAKAQADLMAGLSDLADIFGKNAKLNITPEQEQKLVPVLARVMDAAFRLGYYAFKDAARFVHNTIRDKIGADVAEQITLDHLQGAYISMSPRYKDQGADSKRAVIDVESLDEITKPAATQETKPATLVESLHHAIMAGNMPKDNPALKKLVEAYDGKPSDAARMKEGQEMLEAAIVRASRDVVAKNEGPKSTFATLVRLYESQPNLNIRTSTSIANQAYSTPAPLAFLASELAGIDKNTVVLEPTAGTGMLLIGASPAKAVVNELNDFRASLLDAQGFKVSQKDAATDSLRHPGYPVDAVITNPPFGSVKDAAGKPTKVQVDGYNIGQIDHLIAARALDVMKDDGKAVLILGANKVAGGLSTDDRIFFNWLYGHYNVTGHFEVDGDLYTRQGAGWPVRVISIDGRARSSNFAPVEGTIKRVDNWDQVYEQYANILDSERRPDASAGVRPGSAVAGQTEPSAVSGASGKKAASSDRSEPAGSAGGTGNVAGTSAGTVSDRPKSDALPVGAGFDEQRINAEPIEPSGLDGTGKTATPAPAKPARSAGTDSLAPAEGNQFQSPYTPRSSRKDEGVLIPANMAQPTQDALSRLEDEVGDIDAFAARELGYKNTDELHAALMGLQVDSVAMAIHQIKNGKAVVIADQTGIGKGRQAASIIRWAARQGHIPVFVSVKPSLFTDMYGDLADIGTHDITPFIMNSDAWVAGEAGAKLFANKAPLHRRALEKVADTGTLPNGANALFMTYSQINVDNVQRRALMALAPNAVFVLDESHNAAGASSTGEFMVSTLEGAKGVTYLSATYAKRPDNMPLYFKTDIGAAAADTEGLNAAMASGGLPLQTVVSNNLVKAGQMFRRERSYDGVSIATVVDTGNRALHEKMSNEATKALRAIVSADRMFHEVFVKAMDKEMRAQGGSTKDNAGNKASAGVQHTEFSSVVHNFVKQMLLGLKAQTAADEAIASLKRGEKPIIAVESTMGSFLNEYASNNNIAHGDSLGAFDYRTVLSRALERTRVLTIQDEKGNETKRKIPLSELDPASRKAYDQAQAVIDSLNLNIPVSPIDWMRAEIIRAGYSVAEITGRNLAVDYTDPKTPVLTAIDATEQKDKVNTTRLFNGGQLDALVLNVAGSTGISLHASEKFADQRQRHMIVAQAAGDINIFMQMLGRIHRTGQVKLPKYSILSVDLPTEKRPTAVLSVKMKSLNANTSSNTESATSVKSSDILNKYGDQIVSQYLQDNYDLARALGIEDEIGGETPAEDIARKATGRLALQPIETQHAFYEEVEGQYHALIDYLNKTNQNDLEPRTFDFDAQEQRQEVLYAGPDKTTPFGEDAIYGEYSIKAQGTPMKPAEIKAAIEASLDGKTADAHSTAMIDGLLEKWAEQMNADRAKHGLVPGAFDEVKYESFLKGLYGEGPAQAMVQRAKALIAAGGTVEDITPAQLRNTNGALAGLQFLKDHQIGDTFRVDINSEVFNAVITNVRNTHKTAGNPFSMSKIQVTVSVNGALRSLTIPATQFKKIEVSELGKHYSIDQLFKEQPANQRETAKIVTGNLLAAYGEIKGVRGTIISFTKQDGSTEQGILLPKLFDYSKNTQGDYRLKSGADALKFLQKSEDNDIGRFGIQSRDGVVRVLPSGQGIRIQVPKSKLKGAKYFLDKQLLAVTGDFASSGNSMVASVYEPVAAEKALDIIGKKAALYTLPSMAEEARTILNDVLPVLGKAPADGDMLGAPGASQASPFDIAILREIAAGKSVNDVLGKIAAESTNPQFRELATRLQSLGLKTTIEFGSAAGGQFAVKGIDAKNFAAGYKPKADKVLIFRPENAVTNVLHELVHAATHKAIGAKGVAAKQLQSLYSHVERTGLLRGLYEMENLDEFIVGAFTNPQVQALMKEIPAMPNGEKSKFANAWEKFKSIIKSLLGLKTDTALEQIMQAGEALMAETAALRETDARPAGDVVLGSVSPDKYNAFLQRAGNTVRNMTVADVKQRAGNTLSDYRSLGLQALGRRQLVDIYAGDFKPEGGESILQQYSDLVQRMDADKNETGAEADGVADRWGKLKDGTRLAELMHDATLAQIDPAKEHVAGDNRAQHSALKARFDALSPEARAIYTKARDMYADHYAKVKDEIQNRIRRAMPDNATRAEMLKRMDSEFFKSIKGVYFPLARHGDYLVTVKNAAGETLSVSSAETMNEAEATRRALIAQFPNDTVSKVLKRREFNAARDSVSRGFLKQLFGVFDQYEQSAELQELVNQVYLTSLPDLSWAKHGIHRKGTPGFSQDARRAFAKNMFHGARYLAKLKYSDRMTDKLDEMQQHVDGKATDARYDSVKAQQVVDEMVKRHSAYMSPQTSNLSTTLTSVGYLFYMGLSPASAAVNLSGTPMVAYPLLGGKYGFGKAAAALYKASKLIVKGKNDLSTVLTGDRLAAYKEAVDAGVVDVTMAHDLAGIASGNDQQLGGKMRQAMKWAGWMFHHVERANRAATLIASYDLAREQGKSHADAYKAAVEDTYTSHFDYSAGNRPRIMQGNVARVVLLFKQYSTNMIYMLTRNAVKAAKGDKEALRILSGLLVSHALAAGVLGLPIVGTLLAAASAIGGDDDEPWDVKVALRNFMADMIGQKPAEVMMHGLSRLTPWDISGRVGLDKLLFPDVQEGLEGQRAAEAWALAALGPVAGIGAGVAKGMADIGNGEYQRGLENMLPVALRNPVKAVRMYSEGVKDKTGIAILDETTPLEEIGQALGFSPSRSREAFEGKSAIYNADKALQERRQSLVGQWAQAKMANDTEGVADAWADIKRFNEKNGDRKITMPNLIASVRARRNRIENAEQGVYLPKKREGAREAGAFAAGE